MFAAILLTAFLHCDHDAASAPFFDVCGQDRQPLFWSYAQQGYHNLAGNSVILLKQDGRESVNPYRWSWPDERVVLLRTESASEVLAPFSHATKFSSLAKSGESTNSRTVAGVLLHWDNGQLAQSEPVRVHSAETYGLIDSEVTSQNLYWNVLTCIEQSGYRAEKAVLMARDDCQEEWRIHPKGLILWRYYTPGWTRTTREKFWRSHLEESR